MHKLISERWSPRAFAGKPVEEEKIRALLEAAQRAPSSWNEQPWRFILATKDDEHYPLMLDCLTEKNQRWAHTAPLLMLSVARKNFTKNEQPNRHSWHDTGLAMGNLLLQATAMDLYVHQMAGYSSEKARENLEIPEDYEPVAMAAVGYLGDPAILPEDLRAGEQKRSTRRVIEEVAFRGQWGGPLDM